MIASQQTSVGLTGARLHERMRTAVAGRGPSGRARLPFAALAAGACTALLLAGCGGSTTALTPESAKGGLVIGLVGGLKDATARAALDGARIAVRQFNEEGGVAVRKLKIVPRDDNGSAKLAAEAVKRAYDEGAIAVLGSDDDATATAIAAERLHILDTGVVGQVGPAVYPHGPTAPPRRWVFSFAPNIYSWGDTLAAYAALHCPRLTIVHAYAAEEAAGAQAMAQRYTRSAGRRPALDLVIPAGATAASASRLLTSVRAARPTCVALWLDPSMQSAAIAALGRLGHTAPTIIDAETTLPTGTAAAGIPRGTVGAMLAAQIHPYPETSQFEAEYRKRFGGQAPAAALLTYDSLKMLVQSIEEASSIKRWAVRNHFERMSGFEGLTGTIGFSAQNHAAVTPQMLSLVRFDGHAWSPIAR